MSNLKRNLLKEKGFGLNRFGSHWDPRQNNFCLNKKGQVWVETVIYTLIGLAVIGILLAVSKPKIEEMKDKIVIEQTIKSLNEISTRIYDVQIAPGNKRVLDLKITNGKFYVNSTNDSIGWILESHYKYSQPDKVVKLGNLQILTKEASPYIVTISMPYTINITHAGSEEYISFDGSPSPYTMSVENKGKIGTAPQNVDVVIT